MLPTQAQLPAWTQAAVHPLPTTSSRSLPATPGVSDGLYAAFWPSGQLRHLAAVVERRCVAALTLDEGDGGYVDMGNWGQLHKGGMLEDFVTMGENDSPPYVATKTFETWAQEEVARVVAVAQKAREEVNSEFALESQGRSRGFTYTAAKLLKMRAAGIPLVLLDVRSETDRAKVPLGDAQVLDWGTRAKERILALGDKEFAVIIPASSNDDSQVLEARGWLRDAGRVGLNVVTVHGGVNRWADAVWRASTGKG